MYDILINVDEILQLDVTFNSDNENCDIFLSND